MKILKILFLISFLTASALLLVRSQADHYDCFTITRVDRQDRAITSSSVVDYGLFFYYRMNNKERFSGLLRDAVVNGSDVSINRRNGVDYLRTYFDETPSYIIMTDNRRFYVSQCKLKGTENENETQNSKSR